jgi:phasin family protein
MFTIPEQFSNATKHNFDAQVTLMNSLTNKTLETVEKFIDLNLNAVRSSIQESSNATKQLMAAKDPQEFFTLSTAQTKPNAEKALAYSREVVSLATQTQVEFTKAAEDQLIETNRKVLHLVEEVTKNSPAGSETAVAALKSFIGTANASYDQLSKTTKQTVETLETTMNNAMSQFTHAAEKAMPKTKAKA